MKKFIVFAMFLLVTGTMFAQLSNDVLASKINSLEKSVAEMKEIELLRGADNIYVYADGGKGFYLTLEDEQTGISYTMNYYHRMHGKDVNLLQIKVTKSGTVQVCEFKDGNCSDQDNAIISEFFTKYEATVKSILAGGGQEWVSKNKKAKSFFEKFDDDAIDADIELLTTKVNVDEFAKLYNAFKASQVASDPYAGVLKEAGKYLERIIKNDYSERDWVKFSQRMYSIFDRVKDHPVKTLVQKDPVAVQFLQYMQGVKQILDQESRVWAEVKNI